GIDRGVRVRGAAQASGPRADVVRGAIEACRLEAREPAGVRLGGRGDAIRAEKVAIGLAARAGRIMEPQLNPLPTVISKAQLQPPSRAHHDRPLFKRHTTR